MQTDNPVIDNPIHDHYRVRGTDLGASLGVLQHMRLDIGTGTNESTVHAGNPLPVTLGALNSNVNIAQYGGVATSLGQKANAASIPVALSSDVTKTGAIGQVVMVGSLDFDFLTPSELLSSGGYLFVTGRADTTNAGIYGTHSNIGGIVDDTGGSAVAENARGIARITPQRAFHVNLRDQSGTEIGTVSAALRVDPTGATIQPISGTVTANAGTNLNTSALALESGGNLAAIAASASVLDDWDETDRCKVNLISGQAGIVGGSGVVTANTIRACLASDVALPAGTNNIGDVDVLTLPAIVHGTPSQSGGSSKSYYASLTNTGTTSLSSARKIMGWIVGNGSTTNMGFVKIYDKSSTATSSDTPIAKIALGPGAAANVEFEYGIPVSSGISIRATTAVADSSTASPTANDVFCTVLYV